MSVEPEVTRARTGPAAALRHAMVDRLKERFLHDPRLEAAFRSVPRHVFLPGVALEKVYSGDVIPTRFNEKKEPISSSSEVAVMAEQLELDEGQRVLEIGAGTGYNAAVLAYLVGASGRVTTVDIDPEITAEARAHLDAAGYQRVDVISADGWAGLPDGAPYDRIELTASTSDLSPAWVEQLAEGGILLVPLWLRAGWQLLVAFRKQDGSLRSASTRGGGFMPLRGLGAPSDLGVRRDEWRIVGARDEDVDAIVRLLATEPQVVLGPTYDPLQSWDRMTALATLGEHLIGISHGGRGLGLGLYAEDGSGLAVATFGFFSYLGQRIAYMVHGSATTLVAVRALVEEGPLSCTEIQVEAEPLSSPVVDGGILRKHFRPIVRRSF